MLLIIILLYLHGYDIIGARFSSVDCKETASSISLAENAISLAENASFFNGFEYLYYAMTEEASHEKARCICRQQNATLLIIEDKETQRHINNHLATINCESYFYFISLYFDLNNDWYWEIENPLKEIGFQNWMNDQANTSCIGLISNYSREFIALMSGCSRNPNITLGKWCVASNQSTSSGFICQKLKIDYVLNEETFDYSPQAYKFNTTGFCNDIGFPSCDNATCYMAPKQHENYAEFVPDYARSRVICSSYSSTGNVGFQCRDGSTIPLHYYCDGIVDCLDGSDEEKYRTQFRCIGLIAGTCGFPEINLYDNAVHCEQIEYDYIGLCVVCVDTPNSPFNDFYCPSTLQQDTLEECDFQTLLYNLGFHQKQDCRVSGESCIETTLFSSETDLIANGWLRTEFWIISILIIVGNMYVIITTGKTLRESRISDSVKCNYLIILNISVADLLIGLYLLIISIIGAVFTGRYGMVDFNWRHGPGCFTCGTLVIFASETSCFLLVVLTAYRLRMFARPYSASSSVKIWKVLVALAWLASFSLAVAPPLIVISAYETQQDLVDLNYYGQNSVCLPDFYTSTDNIIWTLTLTFTTVNFCSFLFITIGYFVIYKITSNRPIQNEQTAKTESKMQKRIARIILTNAACWIPICIMTYLSLGGIVLSNEVYIVTAGFLLPINSLINPFLYTNLPDVISRQLVCCINKLFRKK